MNIALFGGSFDPFHTGHEAIIESLYKYLDIEKVFLVPTYLNPFKKSFHLQAQDRLSLLKEIYENDNKINIIDFEVKQERAVPTIETIEYLKSKYQLDIIYLVIGADNFLSIKSWNNYEKLSKLVHFVVITREGYAINSQDIKYIQIEVSVEVSSTQLRENLDLKYIPQKIQKRIEKLWKKE